MDKYAVKALEEYNDDKTSPRLGGVDGKPFWNVNSTQFMYVPSFSFPAITGAKEYIFTAKDSKGDVYLFTADKPTAPLTPVWKDLAPGIVELRMEVLHEVTGEVYLAGARTFCKMSPFPGREALPERACSYKECAIKALEYVFNDETSRYWLTHAVPKPDYYHNVYPSKMISSIIGAMIAYAEIEPKNAADALKLATNAADYLLSITYGEESALSGVPPTYSYKGLIKEIVDKNAPAAEGRQHFVMTTYPASVGSAYLVLEKVTGDKKYFDAAQKIAEYYKKNVLDNGSWYLLVSEETGEPDGLNCCCNFSILQFLNAFYKRTGEDCWHTLENDYFEYIKKERLDTYKWEGQFEDSVLSANYSNHAHKDADSMICYIVDNLSDDEEMMSEAVKLMRFVEDQFVVWGDFAPWTPWRSPEDKWFSPAALEQYFWYVPIDGSAATIIQTFLKLYSVTGDKLYREKAYALGDSITRMQNPDNGVIPTHWMAEDCSTNLYNFWINCHISSAFAMFELAKSNDEV